MSKLRSKVSAAIRKAAGDVRDVTADEQLEGSPADDVDRGDWPEGADITSNETPRSREGFAGVKRKSGQQGTT